MNAGQSLALELALLGGGGQTLIPWRTGRRAIILEVTKAIISSPVTTEKMEDEHGREPFEHPALTGLANLNQSLPTGVFSMDKVAALAIELGLPRVLRWVPRDVCPPITFAGRTCPC
jgi:hypothetical protein